MAAPNTNALTSIRFFAAAAIVLHHSQDNFFFNKGTFQAYSLDGAVEMFFALSGFVLAINAGKYASYADFIVARFARIWPAHLVGLLLAVGMLFPGGLLFLAKPSQFGLLAANLALLQAWVPDFHVVFSYNAPSWSVSCEMFFYVCFLPLFTFLNANYPARALVVAIGLGLGLWAFRSIAVAAGVTNEDWLQYINPIVNLPIFALGILAGIVFMRAGSVRLPFPLTSAIQIAALLMALTSGRVIPIHFLGRFGEELKSAVFFCLLFLSLSSLDGALSRAFGARILVYLGEISYSIYLLHQTIIVWVASSHAPLAPLPVWLQWIIALAIILALSALCHAFVERPSRKWIVETWRRRPTRAGILLKVPSC